MAIRDFQFEFTQPIVLVPVVFTVVLKTIYANIEHKGRQLRIRVKNNLLQTFDLVRKTVLFVLFSIQIAVYSNLVMFILCS